MATLAQAEKAIVAAIKANTIAAKVKLIAGASQALGGGLTKQTAIKFPCISVMFDGGKSVAPPSPLACIPAGVFLWACNS